MVRWSVSLLAMIVLAAGAGAQQPAADPVIAAYKDYVAAQKNSDLTAAEAAAERAWRASEAQSGDGGKTAVLAFNLAIARLSLDHGAAAVEPARRAVALAEKGAAGVNPLHARVVLGEALVAENYGEAKVLLPPALAEARSADAVVRGAAYSAATAFAKMAADRKDWSVSAEAWGSAFDLADGAPGDVEMNRGNVLIGRGAAFAAQHKDPEAFEAFSQAAHRLAPLAPEREDDKITTGEVYYAHALAWLAAISSRQRNEEKARDGVATKAALMPDRVSGPSPTAISA